MSKTKKIVFFLVFVAIFAVLFLWLSGYSYRIFAHLGDIRSHTSGFKGFQNFQMPPIKSQAELFGLLDIFTADKIKYPRAYNFACLLNGILFLLSLILLMVLISPRRSLYGAARFANDSEIQKAGLFIKAKPKEGLWAGNSIIVGKKSGRYLGLSGQQFVYLAAPTRSGKGVGVVIPVALSYAHSIVVLDIKKELFEITADFRRSCGQKVYLFSPFDPEGRSARWNPMSYVREAENLRLDDIQKIAQSLIPDNSTQDPFWTNSARDLFNALALYSFDLKKFDKDFVPTVRGIYDLLTNFDTSFKEHLDTLARKPFVSNQTKQMIFSTKNGADDTVNSILKTTTTYLSIFASELVAAATSADDFDLRKVREEPMTIYIGIQPADLEQAGKIINLFYSQLINENTRTLPNGESKESKKLNYQCLLLMDEGTAAGRINILAKAISYMAGYNLRILLIVQSPAQLRENTVYGEVGTENILSNLALKIMYKPNSYKDAEEYSKLLGKTTIKERSSRNFGGRGGNSQTEQTHSRDLMLPQEVLEMPNDEILIKFEGISHIIKGLKNCYYKDRNFAYYRKFKALIPRKIKDKQTEQQRSDNLNDLPQKEQEFKEIKRNYPELWQQYMEQNFKEIAKTGLRTLENETDFFMEHKK